MRTLAVAILAFTLSGASAHGGVSLEDDTCVLKVGPYKAHFTGYQPQLRASQEFCEDIPVVADAIIVLDYISRPLREMDVDFRIVRDVSGAGTDATYEDLGDEQAIESATLMYREHAVYPTGSFSVNLSFVAPGAFIGVMTVIDQSGREYVSVFPFSVGVRDWWRMLLWPAVALALTISFYFVFGRSKPKSATAA
ncbi:MAG: hypothetical protein AAF384_04175 [Pseudomonadota bacterium]